MSLESQEKAWLEALQGLRRAAQSFLGARFSELFDNVETGLLDLAARAENNEEQNRIFATMNRLLQERRVLHRRYLEMVDRGFTAFIEQRAATSGHAGPSDLPPPEAWQLVDKETIESEIPARNLIERANALYRDELHGIRTRLAVINHGRPVDDELIPAGPTHLVQSWRLMIEDFELTRRLRMVLFALYDRHVMRELEGFYADYNRRLINAGILPHLRYEIRKAPDQENASAERQPSEPASDVDRLRASTLDARQLEETMRAIREALAARLADEAPAGNVAGQADGQEAPRDAAEGRQPNAGPGSGEDAGTPGRSAPGSEEAAQAASRSGVERLVEHTDRLQQEARDAFSALDRSYFEAVRTDPALTEKLSDILHREKLRLLELAAIQGVMATVDHEIIELVGQIFEYMLDDETLPNAVKALLSRLHTPYIKIALSDSSLFVNPEHPARQLMDLMVAAGRRWVTEDDLDRGIFPCLQEMVERILRDYRKDPAVFESLVADFEPRLRELEFRASRIEQRTLEAAEGQQRLEQARREARAYLAKMLEGRRLPPDAEAFFANVWAEKLTLILLRNAEGKESEAWRLANRVLKGVLWTLEPRSPDEAREFRDELEHINVLIRDGFRELARYGQRDFERHFERVREWQEQVLGNPEVELPSTDTLVADLTEGLELEPEPDPELIPEAVRRQIDRLEYGALLDMLDEEGVWQRRKLAWFNPNTNRFLFVDVMGARAEDLGLQALAQGLLEERIRIVSHDGRLRSFLDQALTGLRELLGRGGNRSGAGSEGARHAE